MQALPPKLAPAPLAYDRLNEQQFREALTRYFQQQRVDSSVPDPGQSATNLPGRLVKSIGGGVLGLTNLTESGTLLTVTDSVLIQSTLSVTGATVLAAGLSVGAGATIAGTASIGSNATVGGTLGVTGATTLSSTLGVTGLTTFGATAEWATDGGGNLGARTANRPSTVYGLNHFWLGLTPTVSEVGQALDTGSGPTGLPWSSHVPDYGFAGWQYGTAGAFTMGVTTVNQANPGTATVVASTTSATVWARNITNLADDGFTYSVLFYDCGFNIINQYCGIGFLLANTGTDYQVGHGLSIEVGVKADGTTDNGQYFAGAQVRYFYRDVSGTIVDTALIATLSGSVVRKLLLEVTVSGTTITVSGWKGTGTPAPAVLGTVTMSAAAIAALRDGAHQRVGVMAASGNSGTNPWNFGAVTYTSSVPTGLEADGFAAYLLAPTSGTYAVGGGQYIGNHGQSGLTDSYGLYIDDQYGAIHSHALKTGSGDVSFGDAVTMAATLGVTGASTLTGAVTMASTLGVTGAITGSSTVSATQYTSTIATGTAPLVVASTTKVTNLDAHYLGATGQDDAFFRSSSNQNAGTLPNARLTGAYTGVTGLGTLTALTVSGQITSTLASGTAPFVVASTTVVANLHATNSDQLGGTVAASYALLASPTFTGTPAAPTATLGTNTTQLATTAFVQSAIGAYTPPVTSVFGRTGAVVATTGDYAFSNISGTIASGQVSGSYTGITGVGTLAAGAVPASLVTAGTFGAGDYAFPARLSINTAVSTSVLLAVSGVHPSSSTAPTGVYNSFVIPSTATGTSTYYRASPATQVASYTANTVIGFWSSPPTVNAGSSISSLYGFRADNQGAAGITTSYAFYAVAQSGSTNPWSFYSAGGGNFFTGPLSIYNNSGATNTDVLLRIGAGGAHPSASTSIFGSTTDLGVPATGTTAIGYFARWRTVASAFTASVLEGFRAETFILGAGSSVTTLVGFRVNTQSITTSNSYGLLVADITGGTSGNYAVYTSAGIVSIGDQLVSRVASGTAPFVVASTDLVTNLNADLLDGQHGSYYSAWGNLTGTPTTLAGYGITDAAPLSAITGTVNTIPVWATTTTLGNSLLSQDAGATTVTTAGHLAATTANTQNIGSATVPFGTISAGTLVQTFLSTGGGAPNPGLAAYGFNGTLATPTAIANLDNLPGFLVGGYTGSAYVTTAGIYGRATENWGTHRGTDLIFASTVAGGGSPSTVWKISGLALSTVLDGSGTIGTPGAHRPASVYTSVSVVSPRYYSSGTALATTDYALSAGWGTSPSKAVAGTDTAGRVSITAAATTSANPTVTLTFKGGTFTTIPVVVATRGDIATPTTGWWAVTGTTATTATFTFVGTPTAGNVYILNWHTLSN